ncbi:MAG: PqqD family peptide modification chaperone [Rhodospirillaceae bacterium]|nr:PqqD family peptide modification chaperone [Rhodospirillaceae bacterium]
MTEILHPQDCIKFAPDVERLGFLDEDFIYSKDMEALFSLNTAASFIWRACETGSPLDEIIRRTAEKFQLPTRDAVDYVAAAVDGWRKSGLLEGAQRIDAGRIEETQHTKEISGPVQFGGSAEILTRTYYAVLDTVFEITCEIAAQAERVFAVVGHLEVAVESVRNQRRPAVRIDIIDGGEAQEIYVGGELRHRCETLAEIAPLIHWQVFSKAVGDDNVMLQLHTASVARNGQALLLAGPSGAGKSTLSAALLDEGFGYLSDDMVVLDRDRFFVRGLPFSICVKETALLPPEQGGFGRASSQLHLRADGRWVHYRHPPSGSLVAEPQAAGWVVFPCYDPEASGEVRVMGPAEALRRLLELSAQPRHLTRDMAIALMGWVADLKCCALEYSDTNFAVDAVLEFCDQNQAAE